MLVMVLFDDLLGCTDPTASNTDAGALFDDGSCSYEGQTCETAFVATVGSNEHAIHTGVVHVYGNNVRRSNSII